MDKAQHTTNAIVHCRFRSDNKALSQQRKHSAAVMAFEKQSPNLKIKHSYYEKIISIHYYNTIFFK